MLRNIVIGLAALAAVGTVAFNTSIPAASAPGYNNHRHHHHWRPAVRFHSYSYANCYVRRVIHTPFGPRVHNIYVCG